MAAGVRPGRARRGGARGPDRRPGDQGRGDRPSVGRVSTGWSSPRSWRSAITRTPTSSASRRVDAGDGPVQVVVGIRNMAAGRPGAVGEAGLARPPPGRTPRCEAVARRDVQRDALLAARARDLARARDRDPDPPHGPDARCRPEAGARSRRRRARHRGRAEPSRLPLGLRGGARDLVDPRTPARRAGHRAGGGGRASRRGRDDRAPRSRRMPLLPREDPSRGLPGRHPVDGAGASDGRGDAPGGADRRCHQLRDAGARPAACMRSTCSGSPVPGSWSGGPRRANGS